MGAILVVTQLVAEHSELRRRYVELVVAQALAMPARALIAPSALETLVQRHCEQPALEALLAQVTPVVERCRAQLSASGALAGMWVAPQVQTALPRLLTNPNGPRLKYLAGVADPSLLRRLLAPVLQDVLTRFVARVPAVLGNLAGGVSASEGGLLGRLGRDMGGRGKRLLDAGLSMVSSLGLEQKLQDLAADFSQQAVGAFRESLSQRLQSPEGRALLETMVKQGLEALLQTSLSDLNADLDRVPLSEVLALIPSAVAHAAKQELFGELLHNELHRYDLERGDRSVAELLGELHILEEVRTAFLASAEQHARLLFASEGFSAWLTDLFAVRDQDH